MPENRLKDKVIVIVGGTKGVGRAAAVAFAKEGALVTISGRDKKAAAEVLSEISSFGGKANFVYADLNNLDFCNELFQTPFNEHGRLDGLFYYSGISPVSGLEECDEETFDKIFDINFKSCFFACAEAVKLMKKSGGGSIVLTGSAHAWGGQKDRAAYACSKGALRILSEHIAHNYASDKIRCNYFTLGWTPTEGELKLRKELGESETELRGRASKILPMGRMLEENDYIEALIYLMSDASQMMTGSIFRITAGEYI